MMRYEALSCTGTLYSFSIVRYPAAQGFDLPYTIGLVEIDEQPGVRMAVQVIEPDPERIHVGAPVRLAVGTGPMGAIPVCSIVAAERG
jgi:uncharacterized protein